MAITGSVQFATLGGYPVGIVTGGQRGLDANSNKRRGIGGMSWTVGGLMVPTLRLDLLPINGNCLLDKVLRTTYPDGLPPKMQTLEAGNDASSALYGSAYINSAEIECAVNEALSVSYVIQNLGNVSSGTPGRPMDAGPTFEWYRGVVSVAGYNYDCRRIRFRIENNLMFTSSLDAKANNRRFADIVAAGREVVEVEAEFLVNPNHNVSADDLGTVASIQLTASNGTNTIVIAAANAIPDRFEEPFTVDDWVLWRWHYVLEDSSENVSITIT